MALRAVSRNKRINNIQLNTKKVFDVSMMLFPVRFSCFKSHLGTSNWLL